MLANLPPRNRLIRPVPVPTRCARLPCAKQHLRNAAIAEQHQDESPEELGEELPQHEAGLAPEELVMVMLQVVVGNRWVRVEAER